MSEIPLIETIRLAITQGLPGAHVEVGGDGHHFEALIVSDAFAGRSRIERHRLVYAALGDRMRQEIHALSMRTLTPAEWNTNSGDTNSGYATGGRG
jgi:acid stress-induced BolA-like protein IbaG/YrbA